MRPLRAAALACSLLAACGIPTAPAAAVTARATDAGIVATNHASLPARYLAYTPDWLALADLVPCTDVNDPCPRIPAGSTIVIPWSQVGGNAVDVRDYRLSWSLVGRPGANGAIDLLRP